VRISSFPGSRPRICSNGRGGAFFSWCDWRDWWEEGGEYPPPDGYGAIYVQEIDQEGNPLWEENGIRISSGVLPGGDLEIIYLGERKAGVIWETSQNGNRDIYAQLIGHFGPEIFEIIPSSGENIAPLEVVINGTGFQSGAEARLLKSQETDLIASELVVVSSGKIRGTFDLTGVTTGYWDVKVINPDGQEAVLPEGFLVYRTTDSPPMITITQPGEGTVFTLSQTIEVTALANDDFGIKKIEFYLEEDLKKREEFASPPLSTSLTWNWGTADLLPGKYKLKAVVYDTQDQSAFDQVEVELIEQGAEFNLLKEYVLTPNNDGENDRVNFGPLEVKIYDNKGEFVVELKGSSERWVYWQGEDQGGKVVLPGVYIFQTQWEGKPFQGTVLFVE
jgi:hypothetical protein